MPDNGMSNDCANRILNHIFSNTPTYSAPGFWYLAAFTSAPLDGYAGVECTGPGYARITIPNNTTCFPTATAGVKTLGGSGPVSFPEATGSWGSIVAVGLFETLTGGLVQWYMPLTPQQQINTGDTLKVPLGIAGIQLTLT